jgi:hypothetical protein
MDKWIELEDTYLTNQPMIYVRGKRIPDPKVEPTEAWLFTYRCERTPRAIRRKRDMVTLTAETQADLEKKIDEFISREDVIHIADQRPVEYLSYRGEPAPLPSASPL